ncbi:MAG: aspartate kinase [bacterium]|nr:aspartate kinase [bacterium]
MLIVQKFGGSSVANPERIKNVAKRVAKRSEKDQLVVVVSALGDTTDKLIELAHQITDLPSGREMDMLISTGEQISASLLSMALHGERKNAVSLCASQAQILTDSSYGKARIQEINTKRIEKELQKGNIVIVAGFQGVTEDEDVTTLGRGGSDLTAIALAAVLKAERCEIYTDVEGVFTADPRIVPSAKKLNSLIFDEMLEMASLGAGVMQTRAVEFAKKHGVCFEVRSSLTEAPGTIICKDKEVNDMEKLLVSGITTDPNEAKITVVGLSDQPGIAGKVFSALAEKDINVDMIIQSSAGEEKKNISFTVDKVDLRKALSVIETLRDQIEIGSVISDCDMAKVSVIGVGMMSQPGVAAKMFSCLADKGINIDMISTSEIKISCVIEKAKMEEAAVSLHSAFGLDK